MNPFAGLQTLIRNLNSPPLKPPISQTPMPNLPIQPNPFNGPNIRQ